MMAPEKALRSRNRAAFSQFRTALMTAAARPIMAPVHMPEDDEEYHDAPEAAHAEHAAPDDAEVAADHSDDEHDAYHDAAEDASHPEGGATAAHAVAEPASGAYGDSGPSLFGSRFGGGAAGIGREFPDSNPDDADGFPTSPDKRLGGAAAHASNVSPAGDQFRPYADQQPEVGRIDEGAQTATEALTPEEAQVLRAGPSALSGEELTHVCQSCVSAWHPVAVFDRSEKPRSNRNACYYADQVYREEHHHSPCCCVRHVWTRQRPSRRKATTCTAATTQRLRWCALHLPLPPLRLD